MTLGEKLRALRAISGWTQPECAEKMGIEQSYLSKLENDKSIPSADIFDALCATYKASPDEILKDLNKDFVRRNLMHIPTVAAKSNGASEHIKKKRKRIVLISAGMFILGALCVYLSVFSSFNDEQDQYYYQSSHISYLEIYNQCREEKGIRDCSDIATTAQSFDQKVLSEYKGEEFRENLERGYRLYKLKDTHETYGFHRHIVHFIGILLVLLSILALIIEARFYRIDKQ